MRTVSEIIKKYKDFVADIEVYAYKGKVHRLHTDFIQTVDDCDLHYYDEYEAADFEVMDEKEYNRTIYANCCDKADFEEWYGERKGKVLVIILLKDYKTYISEQLMNNICSYMKNEIREDLHFRISPCENAKFIKEYCKIDNEFYDLLKTEFPYLVQVLL